MLYLQTKIPPKEVLWKRAIILLCVLIQLMVAAFSSTMAYWTTRLRRSMRFDLAASDSPTQLIASIQMANHVLAAMIMAAIVSAVFSIWGIYVAICRTSLPKSDGHCLPWGTGQCIYGLIAIVTGGYVADHVEGFQSLIATFIDVKDLPYYEIVYYGSVAQAAYGALVIIVLGALVGTLLFLTNRAHPSNLQVDVGLEGDD
ncbi:uncharacterized protein N7483_002490 [Penicillium malachiteum]|uniref:uncharacterized protein n=1 Tax=Penicillium malachiteum TaxID=1324776 RepID=UPI0025468339|nr:uncharacterized protein N7483_002490 [Penicillium malachiteum]KAJ5737365.1 hypothetical protein N7483_002490 [Penicillium malachiteum]